MDNTAEVQSPTKELTTSKEILDSTLKWHDEFDRKVWKGNKSFHNRAHIEATEKAALEYLDNSTEQNDPLNLYSDLDKWNRENPDSKIKKEELKEVLQWVYRTHDLGNIMESVTVENAGLNPKYLDKYSAKGAEERSKEIAGVLIKNSDMDKDKKSRFSKVVKHKVGETVFMAEDEERPFARFVRVVDQIGNDLYSTNEDRVEGLLLEMAIEKPNEKVNPDFFYNFARKRLGSESMGLVKDGGEQKALQEIWKPLPDNIEGLSGESILASELLEEKGIDVKKARKEILSGQEIQEEVKVTKKDFDRAALLGRAIVKVINERSQLGLGNEYVSRRNFNRDDVFNVVKPYAAETAREDLEEAEASSYALALQAAIQVNGFNREPYFGEDMYTLNALRELIASGSKTGRILANERREAFLRKTNEAVAFFTKKNPDEIKKSDEELIKIASKSFNEAVRRLSNDISKIETKRLKKNISVVEPSEV